MWNPLTRKKPEKTDLSHRNFRVHIDQPLADQVFQANFSLFISQLYDPLSQLIILCIGTDRSTGDSLGPLVGTKLTFLGADPDMIYGTLENPVHAVNLQETIETIYSKHPCPFIVAVDACLGRSESVGYVSIKEGPVQPGTGVNKNLPAVGDLQIVGIVNIGGFMEYMVLQNTRLNLVMKMAELISRGIFAEVQNLRKFNEALTISDFSSPIETIHS